MTHPLLGAHVKWLKSSYYHIVKRLKIMCHSKSPCKMLIGSMSKRHFQRVPALNSMTFHLGHLYLKRKNLDEISPSPKILRHFGIS